MQEACQTGIIIKTTDISTVIHALASPELRKAYIEKRNEHTLEDALGPNVQSDLLVNSVTSIPQGEMRDIAYFCLSLRYATHDAESAYHWAQAIFDPGLREETSAKVLKTLEKTRPGVYLSLLNGESLQDAPEHHD
ncbi:MAG: hypothetical protein AAF514_17245 [Verrucomicrobiota bacterium]